MKLTRQLICDTVAQRGFFNAKQFSKLGIKWPPMSGWIDRLHGQEVPDETWAEILNLRKLKLPKEALSPDNQGDLFVRQRNAPLAVKNKVEIFFDGGCHGNPGQKYGSFKVLLDGKQVVGRSRVDFGQGTNNEAEFNALQMALDELKDFFAKNNLDLSQCELVVETDSTIVRNRLMVKNKILKKYPRSAVMFELASRCLEVMRQFDRFSVEWKRRDANVERFGH
jgi:ribonuclease HI